MAVDGQLHSNSELDSTGDPGWESNTQWTKTGQQTLSRVRTQTVSLSLSLSLQVFFVSDFFKKKEEVVKPEEISHASFVESPTNGNFESPN